MPSHFRGGFFVLNRVIAICNKYLDRYRRLRYSLIRIAVRIISEKALREFWQQHGESKNALQEWIKVVRSADWESFSDVRKTFNHADIYGKCVIFDVGGNKYRIIGKVGYRFRIVYIRFVLTHGQYDENKWQADCK